jgi:hypothetical protein
VAATLRGYIIGIKGEIDMQILEDETGQTYISTLKDSGERREFATGAVRDASAGKGRCDLIPLDIAEDIINYSYEAGEVTPIGFMFFVETYIRTGEPHALCMAFLKFCAHRGWDVNTAFLEVSKHYEAGALKYADRNWEKGIPLHCYIDSAIRHYFKWRRRDDDEPHDRAVLWNLIGALWTAHHMEELIDLPFKKEEQDGRV